MASLLDKFKLGGEKEEEDVEKYLNQLGLEEGDLMEEEADTWVDSMTLEKIDDVQNVMGQIREGNIVLVDIEPLYKKNNVKLRQSISELKGTVSDLNGDIARLSEEKVLVTPAGIKIKR